MLSHAVTFGMLAMIAGIIVDRTEARGNPAAGRGWVSLCRRLAGWGRAGISGGDGILPGLCWFVAELLILLGGIFGGARRAPRRWGHWSAILLATEFYMDVSANIYGSSACRKHSNVARTVGFGEMDPGGAGEFWAAGGWGSCRILVLDPMQLWVEYWIRGIGV